MMPAIHRFLHFRLAPALAWAIACCTAIGQTPVFAQGRKPVNFLHMQGLQLYFGKLPYRNVGLNTPGLFAQYLAGKDDLATLRGAAHLGALFVRCPVSPTTPADLARFQGDRAAWLAAFNHLLSDADSAGVTVAPILLASPGAFGDALYTEGSAARQAADEYVSALVAPHASDPRVLFWEASDEMNLLPAAHAIPTADQVHDLLMHVAQVIKRADRRHLVSSGNADIQPDEWHRADAARKAVSAGAQPLARDTFDEYTQMLALYNPKPLDFISIHVYPPADPDATPLWMVYSPNHAFTPPWSSYAAGTLKMPLFIGAFGPRIPVGVKDPATEWEADLLRRIVQQEIAPIAAAYWWEVPPPVDTTPAVPLSVLDRLLADANSQIQLASVSEAGDEGLLTSHTPPAPKQKKGAKTPPAPAPAPAP